MDVQLRDVDMLASLLDRDLPGFVDAGPYRTILVIALTLFILIIVWVRAKSTSVISVIN